jgi:hypothetical protein
MIPELLGLVAHWRFSNLWMITRDGWVMIPGRFSEEFPVARY